jgi:hypothetical protein
MQHPYPISAAGLNSPRIAATTLRCSVDDRQNMVGLIRCWRTLYLWKIKEYRNIKYSHSERLRSRYEMANSVVISSNWTKVYRFRSTTGWRSCITSTTTTMTFDRRRICLNRRWSSTQKQSIRKTCQKQMNLTLRRRSLTRRQKGVRLLDIRLHLVQNHIHRCTHWYTNMMIARNISVDVTWSFTKEMLDRVVFWTVELRLEIR